MSNNNNPWGRGSQEFEKWGKGSPEYTKWLPEGFLNTTISLQEYINSSEEKNISYSPKFGIHKPLKAIDISSDGTIISFTNIGDYELEIINNSLFQITGLILGIESDIFVVNSRFESIGSKSARTFLENLISGNNQKKYGIFLKNNDFRNEYINNYEIENKSFHPFIKENIPDGIALINIKRGENYIYENMNPLSYSLGFGILHEFLHTTGRNDYYINIEDQINYPGEIEDIINLWRREMGLEERQTYLPQLDDISNPDLIIEYIAFKNINGKNGRMILGKYSKNNAKVVTDSTGYRYIEFNFN